MNAGTNIIYTESWDELDNKWFFGEMINNNKKFPHEEPL